MNGNNENLDRIREYLDLKKYHEALQEIDRYKNNYGYEADIAVLEADAAAKAGDQERAYSAILMGLSVNSTDYELYFMLGELYEHKGSFPCAVICYEYSLYLCGNNADRQILKENLDSLKALRDVTVPGLSVIINYCGDFEWLKLCVQFLKRNIPFSDYRIFAVSTGFPGNISRWLRQEKIEMISAPDDTAGSIFNRCIDRMDNVADILILSSNTLIMEHTIFNMRLSLYEDGKTAMAGSVALREHAFQYTASDDIKKCQEYAHRYNIPQKGSTEQTIIINSPAVLLKREAVKSCGWFDAEFSSIWYQIFDLGFRFIQSGYNLKINHSCFTPCGGITDNHSEECSKLFREKWKFNLNYSCFSRKELLDMLEEPTAPSYNLLEIGCSCGATLLAAKQRYPEINLYGIELDEAPAQIASHFAHVIQADIEKYLDYPDNFFSCILIGDVLEHLHNPWQVLKNLKRILKKGGRLVVSIPNVMHISVISSLLKGNWTYQDAGILDRTHLRFFTKKEIIRMFSDAGYTITRMAATQLQLTDEEEKLTANLLKLGEEAEDEMYRVYQYLICAENA